MDFLIGCDPEVFLEDTTGLRSVIGKVGGTKNEPLPLPLGEGYMVQEDNVALEFNIPAAGTKAEFVESLMSATGFLEGMVKEKLGFKFNKSSAVSFPKAELLDPRALEFGCEPDFNAWTMRVNPRPAATDETLRSAGGHVHLGVGHDLDIVQVVRACDLHLGLQSLFQDKAGAQRRLLYGKPGAHRPKPYGVEYRTLSNYWIFDPKFIEFIWDASHQAVEFVEAGNFLGDEALDIPQAIETNNLEQAREILSRYGLKPILEV